LNGSQKTGHSAGRWLKGATRWARDTSDDFANLVVFDSEEGFWRLMFDFFKDLGCWNIFEWFFFCAHFEKNDSETVDVTFWGCFSFKDFWG
jgi:hypothetical protein